MYLLVIEVHIYIGYKPEISDTLCHRHQVSLLDNCSSAMVFRFKIGRPRMRKSETIGIGEISSSIIVNTYVVVCMFVASIAALIATWVVRVVGAVIVAADIDINAVAN